MTAKTKTTTPKFDDSPIRTAGEIIKNALTEELNRNMDPALPSWTFRLTDPEKHPNLPKYLHVRGSWKWVAVERFEEVMGKTDLYELMALREDRCIDVYLVSDREGYGPTCAGARLSNGRQLSTITMYSWRRLNNLARKGFVTCNMIGFSHLIYRPMDRTATREARAACKNV